MKVLVSPLPFPRPWCSPSRLLRSNVFPLSIVTIVPVLIQAGEGKQEQEQEQQLVYDNAYGEDRVRVSVSSKDGGTNNNNWYPVLRRLNLSGIYLVDTNVCEWSVVSENETLPPTISPAEITLRSRQRAPKYTSSRAKHTVRNRHQGPACFQSGLVT